ncbi:MAG: ATP-binding cassette domain-containing protein [bacterium]|nr:ATP-binding cassette domain-containing protein [bacterium]
MVSAPERGEARPIRRGAQPDEESGGIKVEGLTKFYGAIPGVQDISFAVAKGEVLGFLGPNGAGKSTTMRILTGFMPPTSGTASVAGFNVQQNPDEVQRNIGYLPESNPLYPEMTVSAYLDFVASVKGLRGADKTAAIGRVVESCGLGQVAHRIIGHLSKGYRQRVGLAQALVSDPPVLILDEPTSGLDPAQIVEIRNLVRTLKGERTIILSTHILPEVSMVCDRVVIIHHGRLAAEGSIDMLRTDKSGAKGVRISALGDGPAIRRALEGVAGVRTVEERAASGAEVSYSVRVEGDRELRPELAAAASSAGGRLTELAREEQTLEELFVRIVSGERTGQEEGIRA